MAQNNPPSITPAGVEYFELKRLPGNGLCSDDTCPCESPENRISRGAGYLYISREVVEMRQDARTWSELTEKLKRRYGHSDIHFAAGVLVPILMCERGAKRRGINMQVANADAKYWWETGLVPLRPTPMLETRQDPPKPMCFVATAAYGSPLAAEVITLSQFRDDVLLRSKSGMSFVAFYTRISPPLASLIAKNDLLRATTRKLFLAPVLRLLKARSKNIEHSSERRTR